MNIQDALEAALQMPYAIARSCQDVAASIARECTVSLKRIALPSPNFRDILSQSFHKHLKMPALMLASAFLVASCVGSGQTIDSRSLTLASARRQ